MLFLRKNKVELSAIDIFELGTSFFLFYALIFFIPIILGYVGATSFATYAGGARPIIYLVIALLLFTLGYRFDAVSVFFNKSKNLFNAGWNDKRIFSVYLMVFLSDLLLKAIRIINGTYYHLNKNPVALQSPFYSLMGVLGFLGPLSLVIAFSYHFYLIRAKDPRSITWGIISWGTFFTEFFYGFFSMDHFDAIAPVMALLIVAHYGYKPSLTRVTIAFLLILFALIPLQNYYRNPISFQAAYRQSQGDSIDHGVERFITDNAIGRINQSKIVAAVFNKTQYLFYGRDLMDFFVSLGPPRFIWKNKPVIGGNGNEFARLYGLLPANDRNTTVGPTMIGDLYMNFGILGITLGMIFFGIFFRVIYQYLIVETKSSLSGVMIYSIVWIQVIRGMEDWIAPVYAGLVKSLMVLLIIHLLLTDKKSNTQSL